MGHDVKVNNNSLEGSRRLGLTTGSFFFFLSNTGKLELNLKVEFEF